MSHHRPSPPRERFYLLAAALRALRRVPAARRVASAGSEPQRVSRPRPSAWFCSMTCQAFFWQRARRSFAMVDLTEEEKAAIRTP